MEISLELAKAITTPRAAYAAFNRGDFVAALKSLDPQIEWSEPQEFPGGGTYHGRDGVKHYRTQSRAARAELISKPEQVIPTDDPVVAFVHVLVRPRGSSQWQDARIADVYAFHHAALAYYSACSRSLVMNSGAESKGGGSNRAGTESLAGTLKPISSVLVRSQKDAYGRGNRCEILMISLCALCRLQCAPAARSHW